MLCFIIKCVKCIICKVTYNTYIHTAIQCPKSGLYRGAAAPNKKIINTRIVCPKFKHHVPCSKFGHYHVKLNF